MNRRALLALAVLGGVLASWLASRPYAVAVPNEMGTVALSAKSSDRAQISIDDGALRSSSEEAERARSTPIGAQPESPLFGVRTRGAHVALSDADVRVARSGGQGSKLRTDVGGLFPLEDLEAIESVEVWHADTFPVEFLRPDLLRIEAVAGVRWLDVDPVCSLVIEVQDQEGRPVRAARVQLFPADRRTGTRKATRPRLWPLLVDAATWIDAAPSDANALAVRGVTGPDGTLRLPFVPCGQPLLVAVRGSQGEESGLVEVGAEERAGRLLVRFPARAELSGRFVYPDGQPVEWGRVHLATAESSQFGSPRAVTDRQGRFVYPGLVPGPHSFVLDAPGEELRTVEVVAPRTDVGDLEVQRSVRLVGRIADGPFGRAELDGLGVVLQRDGRIVGGTRLGTHSTFEIDAPSGWVDVILRDGGQTWGVDLDWVRVELPSPPIVLDPTARTASLQFEVDASLPLDRWAMEVQPVAEEYHPTKSVVVYPRRVIQPRPGVFQIDLLPPGRSDVHMEFKMLGGAILTDVDLNPGATTDLGRIEIGHGDLRGVLSSKATDAPLPGVAVRASRLARERSPETGPVRETITGPDGSFELPRLAGGRWVLNLLGSGLEDRDARQVIVLPNESARVDWEVEGLASLEVRVAVDGHPVADALVSVRGNGRLSESSQVRTGTTDADGSVLFERMGSGTFEVTALRASEEEHDRYLTREVELRAGDVQRLRLAFGSSTMRVSLTLDGRPYSIVVGSQIVDEHGAHALTPDRERPWTAVCRPGPGPWMILARSAEAGINSELYVMSSVPEVSDGYAMKLFGSNGQSPPEDVEVELAWGLTRVVGTPESRMLPPSEALLVRWPPGFPAWLPSTAHPVVELHPAGGLSIGPVPPGAEIILQTLRSDPRFPALRIPVGDALRRVPWPTAD